MSLVLDQEWSDIDQLHACLEQRLVLEGRIENGAKFCANLMLETDAENPKYQMHKRRLEELKERRDANEEHIWELWRRTGACVTLELPKQQGLEHAFATLWDPDGSGGFCPREMRQTAMSWIYHVTFYEFKKFLAPFLFPDLEVNF